MPWSLVLCWCWCQWTAPTSHVGAKTCTCSVVARLSSFFFSLWSLPLLSVAMSVCWPVAESVWACAVGCSRGACVGCSGVSCLAERTRSFISQLHTHGRRNACMQVMGQLAAPAQHTCRGATRGSRVCTVRGGQLSTTPALWLCAATV